MTKTKNCPACQKELPLLAVRCKYCGFKLSNRPVQAEETPERPSAPPPPAARTSAPPPPPPKRASIPPAAQQSQKRTMTLGTLNAPARPVGFGQSAPKQEKQDRSTLPPPPVARPSKSEIATPPASEAIEEELDLSTDVEEWIPSHELGDDTGLLDLDADDIEEIIDDAGRAGAAALPGEEEIDRDAAPPDMFLLRYVLGDEKLDGFEEKGWPAGLVKILGKVRYAHLIGVGAALLLLIVLIVALAGGPDEPEQVATTPTTEQPPAASAGGQPTGAKPSAGGQTGAKPSGSPPAAEAPAPAAEQPATAIPEAGKSCRPLTDLPPFPWKDKLATLLGALGQSGICGMFGTAPGPVVEAFKGTPMVGPGGYDLIKGATLLDVFPTGKADRRGPSIELLFLGDKLFEVRLKYRETIAKDWSSKELGELIEESENLKDHLGRKVTRFKDGDLVIELWEEKWYGRNLRTLVFASQAIRTALESGRAAREQAELEVKRGDELLARKKYEEAGKKYAAAVEAVPGFGLALVKQTLLLLHEEKFDQVAAAANKVLSTSRESSVRAQAHGMIGVAVLFEGDTAKAIAEYKAAAADDPANSLFPMSVSELETGKYDTARVALTAARMECLKRKKSSSSYEGLRARGNFPSMKAYFDVMRVAKKDPKFNQLQKQWVKMECR